MLTQIVLAEMIMLAIIGLNENEEEKCTDPGALVRDFVMTEMGMCLGHTQIRYQ